MEVWRGIQEEMNTVFRNRTSDERCRMFKVYWPYLITIRLRRSESHATEALTSGFISWDGPGEERKFNSSGHYRSTGNSQGHIQLWGRVCGERDWKSDSRWREVSEVFLTLPKIKAQNPGAGGQETWLPVAHCRSLWSWASIGLSLRFPALGCLCDFFLLFNCSVMSNSATPWTAALQAPLSSTISQSLFRFMFIESVMLSHPLLPSSPFTLTLSQQQGLFQWISSLHQVDKVLEFQLQHQSFQ